MESHWAQTAVTDARTEDTPNYKSVVLPPILQESSVDMRKSQGAEANISPFFALRMKELVLELQSCENRQTARKPQILRFGRLSPARSRRVREESPPLARKPQRHRQVHSFVHNPLSTALTRLPKALDSAPRSRSVNRRQEFLLTANRPENRVFYYFPVSKTHNEM